MKKIIVLITTFFTIFTSIAQVQISIPEAPAKVEFANIIVELTPEAQKNVNSEINKLLLPQNKFLDQKLERMQWYFPIIEKILEEESVPEDFKYLAVLESSLIPEALSTSNAVGYWQFKEATALELGLKVENSMDDRKNIYFATKAAALYMKKNNTVFKNWISCMLAYKEGPSGAAKHIPVTWSFASEVKFDNDTHPYVIKALAHRIAYEHRLNRIKNSPKKFVEYQTKGKSFAEIALEMSSDITEIRKYNAWLYSANIPEDRDYTVLIMSRLEDSEEISEKIKKRTNYKFADIGYPQLTRITMVSTSPESPIFYTINGKKGILAQPGQEASQLAVKSKVKLTKFLKYNDMSTRGVVKEGNVYYLQAKNKKAKTPFHTMKYNQTLYDVSQMYGVQLKYLYKYNRMKSTQDAQLGRVIWMQKTRSKNKQVEIIQEVIKDNEKNLAEDNLSNTNVSEKPKEEQKFQEVEAPYKSETGSLDTSTEPLKGDDAIFEPKTRPKKTDIEDKSTEIPEKPIKKANVNTKNTHLVQQGETLYSISKKHGLTVNQLRALNNLSTNESIKNNQILIVKKGISESISEDEKEIVVEKPKPQPVESEEKVIKPKPETKTIVSNAKSHNVLSGETVFSISKKYDVSVSDIQKWNNLQNNSIKLGEKLIVSANGQWNEKPSNTYGNGYRYHKVVSGETLYSISRKYGVNVSDVKIWNNLSDNNVTLGSNIKIKLK